MIGVSRELQHALDAQVVREFRRRALSFAVRYERPAPVTVQITRAAQPRETLDDMLTRILRDDNRTPLGPDVDRAQLIAIGRQYLDDAGYDAAPTTNTPAPATEAAA